MTQLTKRSYTQPEKLMAVLFVITALVVAYGLSHFKSNRMKLKANESAQINYEMAKLKSAEGLYTLENREIEISYKALEAKKAAVKAEAVKKAAAKKVKAADSKKQAVAQKQTQQQRQAQAARAAAIKSSQAKAQKAVADQEAQKTLNNQAFNNGYAVANQTATQAQPNNQEEIVRKSFDEWKNEIFAAKNKEVILKLTVAYKKDEVSSSDFLRLVDEMLYSSDDVMIGLGLYALRINPSYSSYVQLVQIQESVNSTYAAYVQQSLMSYHQGSGLGVLRQALTHPERVVVIKTLEVIRLGLGNIRSGTITTMIDPRNVRFDNSGQFSISNYVNFLPILRDLALNTEDSEIIRLANQSISIIGTQNVAVN